MKYDYKKIGNRIKAERKAKKWSQDVLLKKLNPYFSLGRNTLSEIENGVCSNISLNLFTTLCEKEFFDCDIGYLLCEYDEKHHVNADIKESTGLESDVINIILNMKQSFLKVSILNDLLKDDYFLAIIDLLYMVDYHYEKGKQLDEIESKLDLEYKSVETIEERKKLKKLFHDYRMEHKLHDAKVLANCYSLTIAFSRLLNKRYESLLNIDLTQLESKWKQENPKFNSPIF